MAKRQPHPIRKDATAAISLREGAIYMNLGYSTFLDLCEKGQVRTELKSPTSKRRVTKRIWCDEARRGWTPGAPDAPHQPKAGLTGKALLATIGL